MLVEVTEAEVDNFDVIVVIQQQVFWFEVPVHNSKFVDIFDAGDELLIHLGRFLFLKSPVLDDMLEELAARAVFHDQV